MRPLRNITLKLAHGPAACAAAWFLLSCSAEPGGDEARSIAAALTAGPNDVVVSWTDRKQTMSGFGASVVFYAPDMSAQDAEFLFSQPKGLGLSLLRVSIGTDGKCPEVASAKKAVAYGTRVWASSWTPPPEWKTNNARNAKPNAHLLPSHYGDYAKLLADYVDWMAGQGVPVMAVSPQNEPDYQSDWDGCLWSGSEFVTFIRDNLGPLLAQRAPKTTIIMPDSAFIGSLPGYVDPLVADSQAKKYVSIVATHPYGGGNLNYSAPRDNGKELWQTENSQEGNPPDPTMTSALTMVSLLQDHVITAQMNAWHWWATIGPNVLDDPQRQNPALVQNGVHYKRGYALGNYAKFVRPGFWRIGATESPANGVRVTAFRDQNRVVVVAVNSATSAHMQTFWLDGASFGTVWPWITSTDKSLEKQASLTADTSFSYTLPPTSVTTFVNWQADVVASTSDGGAGDAAIVRSDGAASDGAAADSGRASDGAAESSATGTGGASGQGGSAEAGTTGGAAGTTGGGTTMSNGTAGTASGSGGTGGGSSTEQGGSSDTANAAHGGSSDPSGCSCALGAKEPTPGGALGWLLVLGSVLARRNGAVRGTRRAFPSLY